jgi:AraC family transcriptional regulator of adaptative response / DNA-3-methyladenine glycosylase II
VFAAYAPGSATPYGVVAGQHAYEAGSPYGRGSPRDVEIVRLGIQLILDGGLDDDRGDGFAARLGVSHRQLRRLFQIHAGITPDQLARSSRAHFARRMLDETVLPVTDIAFASGFGSLRQFNRTMYSIFRATPHTLRARRLRGDPRVADGGLVVRLGSVNGLEWRALLAHLRTQAIAGVESIDTKAYRRTVEIDGDVGAFEVRIGRPGEVLLRAHLPDWRGMLNAIQQARRIFNLDVELDTASGATRAHPRAPSPGTWDPFETGIRAIIGQERSTHDASAIASRIVQRYGQPAAGFSNWGLTHTFPHVRVLAHAELDGIGLISSAAITLRTFAESVADGDVRLHRNVPLDGIVQSLLNIPGIDPVTAHYVALRMGVVAHTD